MTIDEVAPLLYGPLWQTPLAHALGLTLRTVQRWAAGERKPTPETWEAITKLLRERQHEIADALKAMPRDA
jgi:hypothetical protein